MSSIKLREGNLLEPYKADVKGFDFSKATTSEEAKIRFDRLVKQYILESDVPDVISILNELRKFEKDIRDSIHRGELTYLPLGSAKELAAYDNPFSQQSVRGTIAWNAIYPDKEIDLPSKVSLLKLNIFKKEDIADMEEKYPEIYLNIINGIFYHPEEAVRKKGLQILAIPGNERIPEWCFPYIDVDTVTNNIISQFKGVLDTFGVSSSDVGKSNTVANRKTKRFTNVVRF